MLFFLGYSTAIEQAKALTSLHLTSALFGLPFAKCRYIEYESKLEELRRFRKRRGGIKGE